MKSEESCECCFVYGKPASDPLDKRGADVRDCWSRFVIIVAPQNIYPHGSA